MGIQMQVIKRPAVIYQRVSEHRALGRQVGFVPTMGALHEGHLSLVRKAREENDAVVVSIFVNPLQFNDSRDLEAYPRTLESDLELLGKEDVCLVYHPDARDICPEGMQAGICFGKMAGVMEGKFRPGHFDGVGLAVAKLFNHVTPHKAYFGLKDFQQFLLIKQMARDLSYPVHVVGLPTVREPSGLAMSSRNRGLSGKGKNVASNIFRGLERGNRAWQAGEAPEKALSIVKKFYAGIPGLDLEYVEMADSSDLTEVDRNKGQAVAICVAAFVEGIRLIDNYLCAKIDSK